MDNLLKEELNAKGCRDTEEQLGVTHMNSVAHQKLTDNKYIITRLAFPGASQFVNPFRMLQTICSLNDLVRLGITIIFIKKEGSQGS